MVGLQPCPVLFCYKYLTHAMRNGSVAMTGFTYRIYPSLQLPSRTQNFGQQAGSALLQQVQLLTFLPVWSYWPGRARGGEGRGGGAYCSGLYEPFSLACPEPAYRFPGRRQAMPGSRGCHACVCVCVCKGTEVISSEEESARLGITASAPRFRGGLGFDEPPHQGGRGRVLYLFSRKCSFRTRVSC